MNLSGGAANAVGIWYQSLGAAVALVDSDWKFKPAGPNAYGGSIRRVDGGRPLRELLTECFDMDAVIRSQHGVELIQFKVSSQQEPPNFKPSEVRDIFCNATQAILQYERKNAESGAKPIVGFIVASNRGIGKCFTALQNAVKGRTIEVNNRESLEDFGKLDAPLDCFTNCFPKSKNVGSKKMRDLAQRLTEDKINGWMKSLDVSRQKCINACLKAMANFAFAQAQPHQLKKRLRKWFQTWGILPGEEDGYLARILGELLSPPNNDKAWNELSIMHQVFGSSNAMPLTPSYIGQAVINDLHNRNWDPPTRKLIQEYEAADCWMLDRPTFLSGLPYSYPPDARIFALVGMGGTGKSALLAQLFAKIGNTVMDWGAGDIQPEKKFGGYPVVLEADISALEEIDTVLSKWAGRNLTDSIKRVAAANGLTGNEPSIWVGLDGLDEISDLHLKQLARKVAHCAGNHFHVRIVLTSRPNQLDYIEDILKANEGLLCKITVDEFDKDQAWEAVRQATNGDLYQQAVNGTRRLGSQADDLLPSGQMNDAARFYSTESIEFERSIRDPLFIGVLRQVYEQGRIELIKGAYREDLDAWRSLAEEYIYVFCDRVAKRLNRSPVNPLKLFNALKQLANDVNDRPQTATLSHWVNVCESPWLKGQIKHGDLHNQCKASGLIEGEEGSWAFEWRHRFVGRYLPDLEWRRKPHGHN